ncbi:hypothetical protein L6164_028717 [Bauhinia variegata]|uniref:Uncharacterized protein n=1 Tax=Bauhinia variegata TaxID=167791 RepID=A0ACB9L7Q5_BAUVA|nr:hypothetical protein L6164_028717 [Bauhinia variegata]
METALSFILDNLPRIVQAVKSELIDFPSEVESEIDNLRNELDFMNAFVEAARKKQKPHDEVNMVVRKIMGVAQQAENVIDTYFYNLVQHYRRNFLVKTIKTFDHQLGLHDVDASIKGLRTSIDVILENRIKYGLEEGVSNEEDAKAASDQSEALEKRRREVEEDDVVGFDKYSEDVAKLLKDQLDSSPRKVVSIHGMAGLGKTTLAKKIYNDHQLRKKFDDVAWATVSKEFKPREILISLLKEFKSISEGVTNFDSMSLPDLKSMMKRGLRDLRYLIFLDDLWEKEHWNEIQDCFPNENNGSRILITSRVEEVVSHASRTPYFNNRSPPYELQPLQPADSWKLFCKRVFHQETCTDPVLEPYAKKIVESCKNLPLSIVVAAGLLQDKTPTEWSDITRNTNWFISQDQESQVKEILRLSYNSLRQELKPCFLYIGLYPVDSEIPVRQLIQQWIAEGFIQVQQTGAEAPEPEVVAEKHLRELISRSLIQED